MADKEILRRPIRARDTKWAAAVAQWLARSGLRPNHISLLGAVCGAGAGACLWFTGRTGDWPKAALFTGTALFIQLRLLCNLFDGMVAVEGGFKTKSGEIYNELPDRFSDAFVFIGAGWSVPGCWWLRDLGWAAALLAVLTAYVRALGGAAGAAQYFCGPMAKQQRMATMTFACVIAAVLAVLKRPFPVIACALALVAAGSLVAVFRRAGLIMRELESK